MGRTLSQPAFAKMVGTSAATIQSVELGRLPLSRSLALRIANAFWANPESLMKRHGKPKAADRTPYSVEFFKHVSSHELPQTIVKDITEELLDIVEGVLLAANTPTRKRFWPVAAGLREWILETTTEFGLKDQVSRVLADLPQHQKALATAALTEVEHFPGKRDMERLLQAINVTDLGGVKFLKGSRSAPKPAP